MSLFTPVFEFSPDPLSDTTPTYTDITSDLKEIEWWSGKTKDLDEPQPGGMSCLLNSTNRRFEPDYVAGEFYPGIDTERRFRLSMAGPGLQGLQFWGTHEFGADGTAGEFTTGSGGLEGKAGAETRQFTYGTTAPTPRYGSRRLRVEVASGDKFGASTGERALLRRGMGNDAWPLGTQAEGKTVKYQFSFRPLAPWTNPSSWSIFQEFKVDARYQQPIVALNSNTAGRFYLNFVTGNFPTAGDATAGTNAEYHFIMSGPTFVADVWWDVRYTVKWTTSETGFFVWEMKQSTDTDWTEYGRRAQFQTLPTTTGDATPPFDFDEYIGFYRNDQAITNVVFWGPYNVGVTNDDVSYGGQDQISIPWNSIGWDTLPNLVETQGGNPDFETNISGTSTTGGGITLSQDVTRSKFGTASLKIVTDGSGSSQGSHHNKTGGTRFDVTAGTVYTASAWYSGDGFQTANLRMEFFDSGSVSLGTFNALAKSVTPDFRRHWVTATAPVGAVTARLGTRWSGTTAGTFYVDGIALWAGTYPDDYAQGVWYSENWEIDWPAMTDYSTAQVTAVDGMGLLAAESLDLLDPPDANSYEDVVSDDEPTLYYKLNDPPGTKAKPKVIRKKFSVGGAYSFTRKYRRGQIVSMRSEAEGVAGPTGSYYGDASSLGLPILGVAGLVVGSSDTAMSLPGDSSSQGMRVLLDNATDLLNQNRITVEALINPATVSSNDDIISGPLTASNPTFRLTRMGTAITFYVSMPGGLEFQASAGATLSAGTTYHVAGVFDSNGLTAYVNGVPGNTTSQPGKFAAATTNQVTFGAASVQGSFEGTIAHVAVYERALSTSTLLAHYNAALNRGFAQQLTGSRISSIVSNPLWTTGGINPGAFQVQPVMEFGQPKLDEIISAVQAERPRGLFFFAGDGNPQFRDFDSLDGSALALDLADGDYQGIEPVYDNEVFNTVTGSRDGGTAITASDSASVSSRGTKSRDEEVAMPLASDTDVQNVVNTIVSEYASPAQRFNTVTIMGKDEDMVSKILRLQVGDTVRIRRGSSAPIDRWAVVLGWRKSFDVYSQMLSCTMNLSRGFNASLDVAHLGIDGWGELDSTFILA